MCSHALDGEGNLYLGLKHPEFIHQGTSENTPAEKK
uniref:Uncharacterized protein n=1 Tax=Anguilla anguilla TaxID=7936 RepID=A0A0E9W4J6_ANGAN